MISKTTSFIGLGFLVVLVLGYTAQLKFEAMHAKVLLELERARVMELETDLSKRFLLAYDTQPAVVAVWEGTNLLAHLSRITEKSSLTNAQGDFMLTHARLGGLYSELGAPDLAEKHLALAARMMGEAFPGRDQTKIIDGLRRFVATNEVKRLKVLAK